jgi:hypothetical protein
MGSIVQAKCSCGFDSGGLYLGGGMRNFQTFFGVPGLCSNCYELKVVNYLSKQPKCNKCEGKMTLYDNPLLSRNQKNIGTPVFEWHHKSKIFLLFDADYKCPSCDQFRLAFVDIGLWD